MQRVLTLTLFIVLILFSSCEEDRVFKVHQFKPVFHMPTKRDVTCFKLIRSTGDSVYCAFDCTTDCEIPKNIFEGDLISYSQIENIDSIDP
jgi:hypothetical protein